MKSGILNADNFFLVQSLKLAIETISILRHSLSIINFQSNRLDLITQIFIFNFNKNISIYTDKILLRFYTF